MVGDWPKTGLIPEWLEDASNPPWGVQSVDSLKGAGNFSFPQVWGKHRHKLRRSPAVNRSISSIRV